MSKRIVVTGASSGLGALVAGELADAGHVVYADVGRADAGDRAALDRTAGGALRPAELDKTDQQSVMRVVEQITREAGPVDVVVHCTGPATVGPAESFTPFQLLDAYDGTVLSAQRANRALLPQMRERHEGLLVWVGVDDGADEEASRYLAPYAAVRAATLQLARTYAAELSRFGVESSIVLTGPLLPGPAGLDEVVVGDDGAVADAYAAVFGDAGEVLAELASHRLDPKAVARAVLSVIDAPRGSRPLHVAVEPDGEGTRAAGPATEPAAGRPATALPPPAGEEGRRGGPVPPRHPWIPPEPNGREGPHGFAAGPPS